MRWGRARATFDCHGLAGRCNGSAYPAHGRSLPPRALAQAGGTPPSGPGLLVRGAPVLRTRLRPLCRRLAWLLDHGSGFQRRSGGSTDNAAARTSRAARQQGRIVPAGRTQMAACCRCCVQAASRRRRASGGLDRGALALAASRAAGGVCHAAFGCQSRERSRSFPRAAIKRLPGVLEDLVRGVDNPRRELTKRAPFRPRHRRVDRSSAHARIAAYELRHASTSYVW